MAKTIDQLTALGAVPSDSNNLVIDDSGVTKKVTAAQLKGDCVRAEKSNALSDTAGTKIGTSPDQLLGFWNATPVDQPAVTADLLDSLQEAGLIASGAGDTPLNLSAGALTCGVLTAGAAGVASLASAGAVTAASVAAGGAVTSSGAEGVGYATGAGGSVTQTTNRTTAVTIDKTCGSITMFTAAGATASNSFTVNNTTVEETDVIILNQRGGANRYDLLVTDVTNGSFDITFRSALGTASDTPVINFAVIKAVES
jgi:hypothetical protein